MGLGPLPPIANVLRVSCQGLVGDRPWANIFHFSYGGAEPGAGGCFGIAGEVAGEWESALTPLQDTSTSLQAVEVTDLTSDIAGQGTIDADTVGTLAGDYLSAAASFLVNYAVDRRYRGGHPRTYLSVGVWDSLATPQTWSTDFQEAVSNAFQAFIGSVITTYGDTTLTGMVAIQYKQKVPDSIPPVEEYRDPPIILGINPTNANYELTLGTQRRRIRKR